MPIATSPSVPRPATFAKMEDRKRPASTAVDDNAPPSKRQAVNGSSKPKDDVADKDKEELWIEEYQKGAIYRQMQEYKREKSRIEVRLQEVLQKSADHDDHIRWVDAWVLQLLQEIQLLVETTVSPPSSSGVLSKTALGFKDSQDFQRLFDDKARTLKSKSEAIFKRLESARGEIKPDVAELEDQIKTLLASQKQLAVKVGRLESENSSLSEQLDTQTLKALKAERKLDRVRSAQVLKLEQQAMGAATKPTNEENGTPFSSASGDSDELRQQYQETAAALAKTKEQLQAMAAEVKTLQEENSAFKIKREAVTDEDYVRTDVFKRFKLQNEDLIKRINNLQAINKELREDAEKLRAERTAYRVQLESEAQAVTLELEEQIQLKDQDLTRIRSARDELTAELAMRKATESQEKTAAVHMKELAEAKDDRIAELESELERLRPKEDIEMADAREDLETLSADELRQKYIKLEKNFEAINMELPLLEKSYKKAMGLAHKKVMDFHALEERVAIITAEKSKADQKYFAARKDTDIRIAENRALRAQNGKSSEIISTLKDLDQQSKGLLGNLEKQVVDLKQSNSAVMAENKKLEQTSAEATRRAEALKLQMSEFVNLVKSKDASAAALKEKTMDSEAEVEKLKVKVKNAAKESEKWKAKAQGKTTMEEEQLRSMVICSICVINFKNTILKGCGHSFCNGCVDDRLTNRMRKCPACNKSFDRNDVTSFHL